MKLQGYHQRLRAPLKAHVPQRLCRPLRCRVNAVLQEDPKLSFNDEILRARLETLLPPSTRDALPEQTGLPQASRVPPPYLASQNKDTVWYFSYGANMAFSTLSRRGVKVLQRCACTLVDPNIQLVFQHRGGYSTLQAMEPGQRPKYKPFLPQVHGVLYQVNKEDMRKLQKHEGGYTLTDVEVRSGAPWRICNVISQEQNIVNMLQSIAWKVETYDGWRCKAQTFVSSPMSLLHGEVIPTEKYMRLLRDGAADNYLDPLYQAWLSSVETVPSAGLGAEYFDTPAKYVAYCFLSIVALVIVGFFSQH